jgi:hypothetical protein
VGISGCSPDLHEVEGVLGVVAQACSAQDARSLFPAIEEPAQRALEDIVNARTAAREMIEESYPAEARAGALGQLGDAARVRAGAELFALRYGADCLASWCGGVGAPNGTRPDGGILHVTTVRGGAYTLSRSADGRYGLVFQAAALTRESRRAFAELSVIKGNAKVYQEQKSLQ